MSTTNDRTQELSKVPKVTALPEGCSVAIIDKSGAVLESIEADKFFQAVRDSIQIGGRNLLRYTSGDADTVRTFHTLNNVSPLVSEIKEGRVAMKIGNPTGAGTWGCFPSTSGLNNVDERIKAGDDFCVSCWVYAESPFTFRIGQDGHSKLFSGIPANQWVRLEMTSTATVDDKNPTFYCTTPGLDKLWIANIKYEHGNIPTDWSPAPEDIIGGG